MVLAHSFVSGYRRKNHKGQNLYNIAHRPDNVEFCRAHGGTRTRHRKAMNENIEVSPGAESSREDRLKRRGPCSLWVVGLGSKYYYVHIYRERF